VKGEGAGGLRSVNRDMSLEVASRTYKPVISGRT
jgi:hypothetical protein